MKIYPENAVNIELLTVDAAPLDGDISFNGGVTCRAPVDGQDFATKGYLDGAVVTSGGNKVKTDGTSIMTGPLVLGGTSSASGHAVSKGYVDTNVDLGLASNTSIGGLITSNVVLSPLVLKVGDVIKKPTSVTPSGYLKCNGGVISQSSYGSLYTVVGSQYNKVQINVASNHPWYMQSSFNTTQTAAVSGWTAGNALSNQLGSPCAIVVKNKVHLFGGRGTGGTNISQSMMATIDANGVIGAWSNYVGLSGTLSFATCILTTDKIYRFGGMLNDVTTNTVSIYTVGTDGTLTGPVAGTALPAAIANCKSIVTKDRVYLIGGGTSATIYTAPIDGTGTVGTWTTLTNNLPVTIADNNIVVIGSTIYVLGGYFTSAYSSAIYTCSINIDGTLGTWKLSSSTLPANIHFFQTVVTNKTLYLFGGTDAVGTGVTATYTCTINSDDTLGVWVTGSVLPVAIHRAVTVVTSSRLYIIGGYGLSTAYYTDFSGGLNDYSSLQATGANPATQFTLPDLTSSDATTTGLYSYIKT